jgi:hypothetical protein
MHFPFRDHRTMAELPAYRLAPGETKVMKGWWPGLQKERRASAPKRADTSFKSCWGCVARCVCPWPQDCPRAAEMVA